MFTSEFEYRKNAINKYFFNEYKWKRNDDGDYCYYKNPKKCLQELKFILDVIFQDEFSIIATQSFRDYNNKEIGYSVIGEIDVTANFNGIYQGEGRNTEYLKFTLCEKAFFYNQSIIYEKLVKED